MITFWGTYGDGNYSVIILGGVGAGVYCWGSGLGKNAVSDSRFAVLSFCGRLQARSA